MNCDWCEGEIFNPASAIRGEHDEHFCTEECRMENEKAAIDYSLGEEKVDGA